MPAPRRRSGGWGLPCHWRPGYSPASPAPLPPPRARLQVLIYYEVRRPIAQLACWGANPRSGAEPLVRAKPRGERPINKPSRPAL